MSERRVDPLERQASLLLYLLGSGGPRTRSDIAARVDGYPADAESMRRQFERDKQALLDQEIPLLVEGSGDDWTYEIRSADYYLPDLKLTDEERLALELALAAVRIGGEAGGDTLAKVGADIDPFSAPVAVALPNETALPALFDARRKLASVDFSYSGTPRHLDPYSVFFTNGYWYVAGFDQARDEVRNFRVDRIDGLVAAGAANTVLIPTGFSARNAIPEPWDFPDEAPMTAVVRIDAIHGPVAADRLGSRATVEHLADGSMILRFEVRHRAAFRAWLFGMLDHAVVLGPPELRDDVISWLEAMAS